MIYQKRQELLRAYARQAKLADQADDATTRDHWSDSWYAIATTSERNHAPRYLTWRGRRAVE